MNYHVENYVVGPVGTNCYFLINDETKEVLITDPGASAKVLYQKIKEGGYLPVAILLTHGHFDHADEAQTLKELAGADGADVPIYAYIEEKATLEEPALNLSGGMFGKPEHYAADIYLKDEEEVTLGGFTFRVLFTPGHTPGSCCFYFKEQGICFTGDTLFCGSVGRTDFPKGSMSALVRSIREKLFTLPEDTVCYPGHDRTTVIRDEIRMNPYL